MCVCSIGNRRYWKHFSDLALSLQEAYSMPQCFTLSVRMLSEQAGSVVELSVFQYSNLSCLPSMISNLLVHGQRRQYRFWAHCLCFSRCGHITSTRMIITCWLGHWKSSCFSFLSFLLNKICWMLSCDGKNLWK